MEDDYNTNLSQVRSYGSSSIVSWAIKASSRFYFWQEKDGQAPKQEACYPRPLMYLTMQHALW